MSGHCPGGRVGGVDDGEGMADGREDATDGWLDQRVVGAAQEESLGVGGFGECFG